jgi:hypothetical protein
MTTTTSAEADHHAFDIAALLGVALVPGHCLATAGVGHACSCGVVGCAEPGAHPLPAQTAATDGRHSLLLPLGGQCDALDVPARTGAVALGYLRLWAVPLGPVIEDPTRMAFLVTPEAREDLPGLLVPERLGDPRRASATATRATFRCRRQTPPPPPPPPLGHAGPCYPVRMDLGRSAGRGDCPLPPNSWARSPMRVTNSSAPPHARSRYPPPADP